MAVTKVSQEIHLTEYPVGMPTDNNFQACRGWDSRANKRRRILGTKYLDVCRSIYER